MQVDRMPIGLIVWDRGFHVKTWNPSATRIFGFTQQEAIGKHPYELIVPKPAKPQIEKIWTRLLKGDTTANSVNENLTKDGRTITCDWANTPLREKDGSVIGVLSMVQDVTELKKIEYDLRQETAKLENITESIGVGLTITSKDYNILWTNKVMKRFRGIPDLEGRKCYATYNYLDTVCPECGVKKYRRPAQSPPSSLRVLKRGTRNPLSTTSSSALEQHARVYGSAPWDASSDSTAFDLCPTPGLGRRPRRAHTHCLLRSAGSKGGNSILQQDRARHIRSPP